jgi:hypothetical protein
VNVTAAIFGNGDARAKVAAFVEHELGAVVVRWLSEEASSGHVAGAELADGRRVLVKVHPLRYEPAYLKVVHEVQAALHEAGFPAPRPLLGPRPLGRGHATVEDYVDDGDRADAHDPAVRRELARLLAWLIELARPFTDRDALDGGFPILEVARIWPEPHDPRFDFERTSRGAEWIDEVRREAQQALATAQPFVVGHSDWSAKHFRVRHGRVTVVYDWDLARAPETVFVGFGAATFTATWYLDVPKAPSPEESAAFVTEYERARGSTFSAREREEVAAAARYVLAYTARCAHSDAVLAAQPPTNEWTQALRARL